jgi:alanyl-tRNA synthetase
MLTVSDLRNSFIDYFKSKEHKHIHSSPLIPYDDPTLLFTTAGMVQFKPMFAGTVKTDYNRATTVQKCLRTSDLENVGRTKRHCTFFEMLGNFSFGDYFKKEAIEMAWEYSVDILKFDPEKIWVSIYQDDDEAFEIWNKEIGVNADKIIRLGKEDNFWGPAGDTGACGPCSELYIDKGEEFGCSDPECKPGCDCERYMEYWNLVFNQFDMQSDGTLKPLPKTGIDTGMGLERLATICQDVSSIFETDELKSLVDFVCDSLKITYYEDTKVPVNVIVEHARSLTFAMADGAYPSNEGRGYVLRRILRRALRFARTLGVKEPFVYSLVDPIVKLMGTHYPEIATAATNIKNVLHGEEKRFLDTLETGMNKLTSIIDKVKQTQSKMISGADAFVLYDTYGFPVEMTNEMAGELDLSVNMDEFNDEMDKQRSRGKKSWKGDDNPEVVIMESLSSKFGESKFTGYESFEEKAKVLNVVSYNEDSELTEGQEGFLILDKTPFYGESGGQAGDTGRIISDEGEAKVVETKKLNKSIIHKIKITKGVIRNNDEVTAVIDSIQRNAIKANHTVTHLLQAALQKVLGTHVKQSGSYVGPDRMRFDFSHFEAMSDQELDEVESLVNRRIWENLEVTTTMMNLDDALASGAMAEFGEKYEDTVRVVKAGDFSTELCGGTHVKSTAEIGSFKILKESSPGAGTRRIEGITLRGVKQRLDELQDLVDSLTSKCNTVEKNLHTRISQILEQNNSLQKEIESEKSEKLTERVDEIISRKIEAGSVSIITFFDEGVALEDLRELSDKIRNKEQKSVVLLATFIDEKVTLLCAATQPVVKEGVNAGAVIKEIAPLVGGKGGGRPDMAQAGGKDKSGITDAIDKGIELIKGQLEKD